MSFLKVVNLSQSYGQRQILKKISFDAKLGEIVAFLGPNGAGKTTLLRTVIGLLSTPEFAEKTNAIYIDGNLANDYTVSNRTNQGLLYLPQQTSLFLNLTALDNLRIIYEHHDYWIKNRNEKEFSVQMHKWLEKTSLTNVLTHKCYQLSGGQKRKLEIVRCLLMNPKGIMLDEPFAGVDPKSIYELKSIFTDLSKGGISILISDHNVDQLLSIASRIYVIVSGEVVVSGGIKEVMNNKFTREMYLGNQFHSEMHKRYLD